MLEDGCPSGEVPPTWRPSALPASMSLWTPALAAALWPWAAGPVTSNPGLEPGHLQPLTWAEAFVSTGFASWPWAPSVELLVSPLSWLQTVSTTSQHGPASPPLLKRYQELELLGVLVLPCVGHD